MSSIPNHSEAFLQVRDLTFSYSESSNGRAFRLHVKELDVREGEVLALCGASGSGKSALLAILLGPLRSTSSHLFMRMDEGPIDPYGSSTAEWRGQRRHLGFVNQDPRESFNERRKVVDIVADPLQIHRLPGISIEP